jgi:hypothetical protein
MTVWRRIRETVVTGGILAGMAAACFGVLTCLRGPAPPAFPEYGESSTRLVPVMRYYVWDEKSQLCKHEEPEPDTWFAGGSDGCP